MTPEQVQGWFEFVTKNGVAGLLFLAVVGLFTGQVFTKRQADQLLKMQQERYEYNIKQLEKSLGEEQAARIRLEQLLFQRDTLANRVGAIAERVIEKAASGTPTP